MRFDAQVASRDLERCLVGLTEQVTHAGEPGAAFLAAFHDLGQVLFRPGAACAALDEICRERKRDAAIFAESVKTLARAIRGDLAQLHGLIKGCIDPHLSNEDAKYKRVGTARELLDESVPWSAESLSIWKLLERFAQHPAAIENLSDAQLRTVRERVLPRLGDVKNEIHSIVELQASTKRLDAAVAQIERTLQPGLAELDALHSFYRTSGLATVDELRQLYDRLEGAWKGPVDVASAHALSDALGRARDIAEKSRRVGNLVKARLERGPLVSHAVNRLSAYLEFFGRQTLLMRLKRSAKRKREAIIQETVDGFLFSEGLFPITHIVAGPGRIDTLFEEKRHLFDDHDEQKLPVLLELKQAVTPRVTTRGLRQAVARARAQAAEYKKMLAANASWIRLEPIVLIVYRGPTRYSSAAKDVRLVYLGDAVPSKTQPLDDDLAVDLTPSPATPRRANRPAPATPRRSPPRA